MIEAREKGVAKWWGGRYRIGPQDGEPRGGHRSWWRPIVAWNNSALICNANNDNAIYQNQKSNPHSNW